MSSKPSQQGSKASAQAALSTSKGSNATTTQPQQESQQSKYAIVKEGWGDRPNFQASYGLKMTPEDLEEGNAILDGFMEADRVGGQRGSK